MKIIACLGNPGNKYSYNRHNAGFIAGGYLCSEYRIDASKKSFSSVYGIGKLGIHDIAVIFPQTFMNLSGKAVQGALSYYKTDENDLIVIHDEIEIPFADIRMKRGGGHKGHNGIRSIMQVLGTGEFMRIRVGVGRPPDERIPVADFLLSDFLYEEREKLPSMCERVKSEIEGILS
jgi:peptidyl-tRNA hydrolase, PTH1 family